jgi:hypothetical protein
MRGVSRADRDAETALGYQMVDAIGRPPPARRAGVPGMTF